MPDKPKLTLKSNIPYTITMSFDSPKTGEGKYGKWYMYGVEHDGEEKIFFPTELLHNKLEPYGKGDTITIEKMEMENGKIQWLVTPEGETPVKRDRGTSAGTKGIPSNPKGQDWDLINAKKSYDIHKQVCLKLAIGLEGNSYDFKRVEKNMNKILHILTNKYKIAEAQLSQCKTLSELSSTWDDYSPIWEDEFTKLDFENITSVKEDVSQKLDVPF